MIDLILPYIKDDAVRALPAYQTFLKAQAKFISERYRRLILSTGHESPGIRLLRYILQFVDKDYLDLQVNNYERYSNHIRYIRRDLENIFDRNERGRGYYGLFFPKGSFATEEFLFPVEDINSISGLPLYTDDWNVWKRVRPLRLWAHDSNEFTTNLINDRVKFHSLPPSYAVELLDVVALTFKYYIWYKHARHLEQAEEMAQVAPEQLFLHKYVMCDWVWDLGNIWLLAELRQIFDLEQDQMFIFSASSLQIETQYGWIVNNVKKGFQTLWETLYDIKRHVRPEALLSSKILFNGSINDRIRLTDERLVLPPMRQYDWMRYLRDRELVEFVIRLWRTRPELPTTKRMLIQIRREWLRILNRKPWSRCNSPTLKAEIEADMNSFNEWLQG